MKSSLIGRVHDHGYLLGRTTSSRKHFLAGFVDSKIRVGKADAPSFQLLEEPNPTATFRKPENGNHQLRHRIVKIEDDLGTQKLRYQGAEHQDVRHVVDMDKIIPLFPPSPCHDPTREQNEHSVPKKIREFSPAEMLHGNAGYVHAVQGFVLWFFLRFSETDHFDCSSRFRRSWLLIVSFRRTSDRRELFFRVFPISSWPVLSRGLTHQPHPSNW